MQAAERTPGAGRGEHEQRSGSAAAQPATVDSSQPILAQVGKLGREYSRWLHTPEPVVRPRFFGNPLLEAVTATEWWVVPLVWLPLIAWGLTRADAQRRAAEYSPAMLLAGLLLGGTLWQCLEYAVHRFVFHNEPTSAWGVTVHFTLHGCHHKFPLDRGRLVFPPLPAFMCALGLRAACRAALPPVPFYLTIVIVVLVALALPTLLGILMGYLTYDCLHYAMHQGVGRRWPLLKQVRAAHMGHHFRDPHHGFGITSPLLDVLLGTLPPKQS